jgi:hypothetical protein
MSAIVLSAHQAMSDFDMERMCAADGLPSTASMYAVSASVMRI